MRLYTLDGKKCNISGERIRQWRLNAGLTQEELAIKMQLSGLQMGQMAISRIETGKRLVADFELKIFAHALGVTMEWLTTENENEAPCFCMALHFLFSLLHQMAPCRIFDPLTISRPGPREAIF